jgi:hypothetical protein
MNPPYLSIVLGDLRAGARPARWLRNGWVGAANLLVGLEMLDDGRLAAVVETHAEHFALRLCKTDGVQQPLQEAHPGAAAKAAPVAARSARCLKNGRKTGSARSPA